MPAVFHLLPILLLAASSLLVAACGQDGDPGAASGARAESEARDALPPFGARQTGPERWEAVIYTYNWGFQPEEIRVPVGSEVTFRVTSRDDFHGFTVEGTDLRLSAVAPDFATGTHRFLEEGTYRFQCDTYCGAGHYTMEGSVVVVSAGEFPEDGEVSASEFPVDGD